MKKEKLNSTEYSKNVYYKKIIDEFLEMYSEYVSRLDVIENTICVKANDRAGSRKIVFTLNKDNLLINIYRVVYPMVYQDIMEYNSSGIMVKRSTCSAGIRKNKSNDLQEEIKNETSEEKYTPLLLEDFNNKEKINNYDDINIIIVERLSSDFNTGKYFHKHGKNLNNGEFDFKLLEGTFDISRNGSNYSLEIPNEQTDVNVSNANYDYTNTNAGINEYPSTRKL